MSPERSSQTRDVGRKPAPPSLDDLVPLAAVIGAGCAPCAERMVARALEREDARPSIERTLAILARVAGATCLAEAVGPESVERMKRSLRAGQKALDSRTTGRSTCRD